MTKVSYIHGFSPSEALQRAQNVPAQNYIDYANMTEGDLRLHLLFEQVNILAGFYPENQGYQEAREKLGEVKNPSIKGYSMKVGKMGPLDRYIAEMKRRRDPAVQIRRPAISGALDCALDNFSGSFGSKIKQQAACLKKLAYTGLLNERLEQSGHHIMYAFEERGNVPGVVAAKALNHRLVIAKFEEITGISGENLRMWTRNGIMRQNAKQGIEPYSPEASINIMREVIPYKRTQGIGEPASAFLIALPKIIAAIGAAVSATAILIDSLEARDSLRFRATVGDIGLAPFGPEESDWYGAQSASQGNNDLLVPLALAAGAYMILS